MSYRQPQFISYCKLILCDPIQCRINSLLVSKTETDLLFKVSTRHKLIPLRKHAYSNILKMLPRRNENFQIKNSDIFHISAQNIDCGYSLEAPR